MNVENFKLCSKLIPSSYVQQGENARKSQEHKIKTLLEHVSIKYNIDNILPSLYTALGFKQFVIIFSAKKQRKWPIHMDSDLL